MSILSGAHNHLFPKVIDLLKEQNAEDIIVIAGGVIPEEDIPVLKEKGIKAVYTPGTPTKDIIEYIKNNVKK